MEHKTILITGGTGSLGQVLTKYLLTLNPRKIIIFSRGEEKQVAMKRIFQNDKLRFFIGDIRDRNRLRYAFNEVDYIFHCAALKHIDKCEEEPEECIKTNIWGSMNIIDIAIEKKVKKVLAISTDKAVNPSCFYGACKQVGDRLFCRANVYSPQTTKFSVIRFGNFIDSSESVIPLFKYLRDNGEIELPITDFNMTRWFISLEKAAQRTCKGLELMKGGEIFVPKMRAAKIIDIAKFIHPWCEIKQIGKRPGEKVHEDLICNEDICCTIETDKFYITSSDPACIGKPIKSTLNSSLACSSGVEWINQDVI